MTEREQLEQAIAALEAQRAILGDPVAILAEIGAEVDLTRAREAQCEHGLTRSKHTWR